MIISPKTRTFCQIQNIRPDRIFNPEKEDMSGKNRMYGIPTLDNGFCPTNLFYKFFLLCYRKSKMKCWLSLAVIALAATYVHAACKFKKFIDYNASVTEGTLEPNFVEF